jgi:hypothetical protein
MGNIKWRKLQKWAYVLYVTLFIHAMGIQVGGMLNPRGGHAAPRPATVETTVTENARPTANEHSGHGRPAETVNPDRNTQSAQTARPTTGGRMPTKGLSDIKVSAPARGYIHIISLILIYGSYLYLRLRKARKDTRKVTAQ